MATTITDTDAKLEARTFDTVDDMIDWATSEPWTTSGTLANLGAGNGESGRFIFGKKAKRLFKDKAGAQSMAYKVWDEGLTLLDEAREKLADVKLPAPVSRRRKRRFSDDSGDAVDFDRLRAGRPFWEGTHRTRTRGPAVVHIAVDTCAAASYNSADLLWRGLASIVVAEVLEAAGYRVELTAYVYHRDVYSDGYDAFQAVTLKAANAPLDTAALVAATSGWFFRSIVFGAIAHSHEGRTATAGMGWHKEPDTVWLTNRLGRPVDFKVDGVWSKHQCIDFIEKAVARIEAGELTAAA